MSMVRIVKHGVLNKALHLAGLLYCKPSILAEGDGGSCAAGKLLPSLKEATHWHKCSKEMFEPDICKSISSFKRFGMKQGCSCCKLR